MPPPPPYDEWFAADHGLPHPIWWPVGSWTRAEVTPEREEEFWHEFVRQWLGRLASALGPDYVVDESANFHLLSTISGSRRGEALKFLERIRETIRRVLGERIEPRGTVGKHLVLRFAQEADYYRYVSHFYPDGEAATSGGMCLSGGYVHVATFEQVVPGRMGQVLVHELTHNLTMHLPNPNWLREGLAMFFESDMSGGTAIKSAVDLREAHRSFWNPETIQQFWKGESFFSVEGQEVSYSLADTLFRLIRTDVRPQPETFQRFVLAADWNDGGEAAARDYLGIAIEDIAAIFLGPGDWRPKPETWKKPDEIKSAAPEPGKPDENGFVWPEGLEPEPEGR